MLLNFWSTMQLMSMPKVSNAVSMMCNRLMFTIQAAVGRRRSRMLPKMVMGMLSDFWPTVEPCNRLRFTIPSPVD